MKNLKHALIIIFLFFSFPFFIYSQQQLSNSNFENWINDSIPDGWAPFSFYDVYKTSDSYQGNSAMVVWKWYTYVEGRIIYGSKSVNGTPEFIKGGEPIADKPNALSGFYKYLNPTVGSFTYEGDTMGVAIVILKKYNIGLQRQDTVGIGIQYLPPSDSYMPFKVNITDLKPGVMPDSIVVGFLSSIENFNDCNGGYPHCEKLYIDELSLLYTSDIDNKENVNNKYNIFPNLLGESSEIHFPYRLSEADVILLDLTGKSVMSQRVSNNKMKLERENLAKGLYIIKVIEQDKVWQQKLVLE